MPCRDPRAALEDILENSARIERFVGGLDAYGFHQDDKTIFAVQYALLAISDAACRLGDHAAVLCPDTPCQDIRHLGVGLRHGDDRLPRETIWATVQQTLGPLADHLFDVAEHPAGDAIVHDLPHGAAVQRGHRRAARHRLGEDQAERRGSARRWTAKRFRLTPRPARPSNASCW